MKEITLEQVTEFYEFLQGKCPDGLKFGHGHQPKLSTKKAFAIIYYLQEQLKIFSDRVEKCDNCNDLFDTWREGLYWESKGKHYCGGCEDIAPTNYDKGLK